MNGQETLGLFIEEVNKFAKINDHHIEKRQKVIGMMKYTYLAKMDEKEITFFPKISQAGISRAVHFIEEEIKKNEIKIFKAYKDKVDYLFLMDAYNDNYNLRTVYEFLLKIDNKKINQKISIFNEELNELNIIRDEDQKEVSKNIIVKEKQEQIICLISNKFNINMCQNKGMQEDMIFGKEEARLNQAIQDEKLIIKNFKEEISKAGMDLHNIIIESQNYKEKLKKEGSYLSLF